MPLSMHSASVPLFHQMLLALRGLLDKAEAHAMARKFEPAVLLQSRLAPDMLPFLNQIQLASDAAKSGAARLAGVTPPGFPDTETTWAEVKARVANTIAFVEGVDRAKVDGDPERTVELPLPTAT